MLLSTLHPYLCSSSSNLISKRKFKIHSLSLLCAFDTLHTKSSFYTEHMT